MNFPWIDPDSCTCISLMKWNICISLFKKKTNRQGKGTGHRNLIDISRITVLIFGIICVAVGILDFPHSFFDLSCPFPNM